MLYDLSFLDRGRLWPPPTEVARLEMYEANLNLFEGEHPLVFTTEWTRVFRDEDAASFELILNWPKRLSTLWADLLWGEAPQITSGPTDGPAQVAIDRIVDDNDLQNVGYEVSLDVSRFGVGIFKIRYDDGGVVEAVPPSVWFPIVQPNNIKKFLMHVLAYPYWEPSPTDSNVYLARLSVEIHEPGKITYRVYDLGGQNGYTSTTTSSTMPERPADGFVGLLLKEEVELTKTKSMLVIPVPNLMTSGKSTGLNDYDDLQSLVCELELRCAQISRILDKHADPILAGDESMFEWNVENQRFEVRAGRGYPVTPEGKMPQYVVWDGSLENAFVHFDLLMNQFYALSCTSAAAFGDLKSGLAESGSALRRLMMAPLAKVNRMRLRFNRAVKQVLICTSEIEVALGLPDAVLLDDVHIDWNDGLPEDETEQTSITTQQVSAGVMSQETAVRHLQHLEGDDLQNELDRLSNQKAEEAAYSLAEIDARRPPAKPTQ